MKCRYVTNEISNKNNDFLRDTIYKENFGALTKDLKELGHKINTAIDTHEKSTGCKTNRSHSKDSGKNRSNLKRQRENDGGEILFGQKTLQSRETLDEGKDFIKCNIRKLKKKEGWN